MQGVIKLYRIQKGFGFILGKDEKEYFFHITQIKPTSLPILGAHVEFDPNESDKGLFATNIVCLNIEENSKFIKLGNIRIKASNIKDYGISQKIIYYQKIYKQNYMYKTQYKILKAKVVNYVDTGMWYKIDEERYEKLNNKESIFLHIIKANKGECIGKNRDSQGHLYYIYAPHEGVFDLNEHCSLAEMGHSINPDDVKKEVEDYLYITTYQGDYYQFYKSKENFDIYDKLKELDHELI